MKINPVYEPRATVIPAKIASETEMLLKLLNVTAYIQKVIEIRNL